MTHSVALAQTARDDLSDIALWITEHSDRKTALGYLARIEKSCETLAEFPDRGTPRPSFGDGIRSLAFERRATIFYRVKANDVIILHVAHVGRDPARLFGSERRQP